ncbi:MAG: PQQ-like beta-propeller repeat protein [Planctomycetaceae bacterium]|nr:PQQ-like beta-propeller repeat protein [Planctomycetaceae bacterium]
MHAVRWLIAVAVVLSLKSFAEPAAASDWNRFRGPNGTGVSTDSAPLPVEFGPDKNLKWKADLPGAGVSCPIIVGDRVFLTCYSGYGLSRQDPGSPDELKRHLVCLERGTGKTLWTKTYASEATNEDPFSGMGVPEHGYASHTPASDGTHVFVFFGKGGAYAFDLEGNELWHTMVGTESDDRRWGSSSSPIVSGNVVVIPAGAESRAMVGLEASTGKELWRAEADSFGSVWGTPAVARREDGEEDIVIGAPYEIWGINPVSGKLRWYCEAMATDQFNSSVVIADNLIYAIEGRGGGSIAIRSGGKGNVTETHVAWSGRDNSRFGSPVVYDGRLYYVSGGVVSCLNAETGERLFQGRLPAGSGASRNDEENNGEGRPGGPGGGRGGFGGGGRGGFGGSDYASLVLGDGKLYYVTRGGDIHVMSAGSTFEHLAVNRVTADREDFSATPAISEGQLFFRSNKALYCVQAP